MKTARVDLCARVSTADQQTLPAQVAAMSDYAQRRGWVNGSGINVVAMLISKAHYSEPIVYIPLSTLRATS
jgi:predicted site-specific integrase-resolvase